MKTKSYIYFCNLVESCYINRTDLDPPPPVPTPIKVRGKTYIIETSFLASWYRAEQFCRLHGMNLASIHNQEENDRLGEAIVSFGKKINKYHIVNLINQTLNCFENRSK